MPKSHIAGARQAGNTAAVHRCLFSACLALALIMRSGLVSLWATIIGIAVQITGKAIRGVVVSGTRAAPVAILIQKDLPLQQVLYTHLTDH